jgi:hypothetical protein
MAGAFSGKTVLLAFGRMCACLTSHMPALRSSHGETAMAIAISIQRRASMLFLTTAAVFSLTALTAQSAERPLASAVLAAGDLRMSMERTSEGLRMASLTDAATGVQLLAAQPAPLFSLTLREGLAGAEAKLGADAGWTRVDIAAAREKELTLQWFAAKDPRLAGIQVTARARADERMPAICWRLDIQNTNPRWGVWRVVFPQAAVADFGASGRVFLPRGPGEVQPCLWSRPFAFRDTYPGAWMTMQFMAAYDPAHKTGLYLGLHDPTGGTKDLAVESRPKEKAVAMQFDVPVPDMGRPGVAVRLEGEAVWRLLRGDWFDAAVAYRDWVRRQAGWYPTLGPDGRTDTTPAMRLLDAWALGGADPWPTGGQPSAEKLNEVKQFAKRLGPPIGMHWYGWHQNPFDNDYPHYFPAKSGFTEAVADLQRSGVLVMPYINGRLWDTRDRGVEDFEFTRVAKPFTAKDERGHVVIEEYGSKESDGSTVRFAVMCPATKFWQDRVHAITMQLYKQYGVRGVYIDQIAASAARLCFDPSHSHPLGGGHWWADGYRQMLDRIRRDMPQGAFLTTECNAEAYVRWFDGYLTWHWQYDGQVPAFPAVYGGALQMFGRSYGGGPTRDLALRMKAAQQLNFGEQIGWIGPNLIGEKSNFAFFQSVVQLRRRLGRYFAAGEMARPPIIEGELPAVKADWGWGGGNWWVTTGAVLTSAWRSPKENRLAVIAANVSDQPVTVTLALDAKDCGLTAQRVEGVVFNAAGPTGRFDSPMPLRRKVSLAPHEVQAWELTPAR